jgi:tetratricopeptide (TPR) repeat protein
MRLAEWLSAGVGAKGLYENLAPGHSEFDSSLTAGVLFRILPGLRLGAHYSFLYSGFDPDLGLLKFGAAWAPELLKGLPTQLHLDFSMPPQGVYRLHLGVEQPILSALLLRLGYQQELKDNLIGGFRGLTGGFGVRLGDWGLDYAFAPNGDLGSTHTAGLSYRFPERGPGAVRLDTPAELRPEDRIENVQVDFDLSRKAAPSTLATGIQEALAALNARIQADPRDAGAWHEMGRLYWGAGRRDYALQCFEEALRLQPGNEALRRWLEAQRKAPRGGGGGE